MTLRVPPPTADARRPGAAQRCVLIVEDDADSREMYTLFLFAAGFDPRGFDNTDDAFEAAIGLRPAVIVADVRFAIGPDGIALLRRVRADDRTRGIPVIVITAAAIGDAREHASAAGCDAFLVKPCLPETLAAEIDRVTREPHREASIVDRRPVRAAYAS